MLPLRVITPETPLALGSASPRRRALLESLGLPLVVLRAEVDESTLPGESPDEYLARVVQAKLEAAARVDAGLPASALLVADTVVLLESRMLGKPADVAEAERMVSELSGRAHEVRTRFAIES